MEQHLPQNFNSIQMKKVILAALLTIIMAACTDKKKETKQDGKGAEKQRIDFPAPKSKIKTVGILLYDNYALLDAMGPYNIFSELMGAKVFFVGRHKGMIYTSGMSVQCDSSINEVKQLDILVIPGGLTDPIH